MRHLLDTTDLSLKEIDDMIATAIDIIDNDTVSESNINRQIIALRSTIGSLKTETAKKRVLDINPDCKVTVFNTFVLPENIDDFDFSVYSYVVDAIDTVSGKLAIIEKAYNEGIPVISSMGTGNKLDPTKFTITDISKTSVCPLARVMRYELKKRGIKKLKVVYSKEKPVDIGNVEIDGGKNVGSISKSTSFILAGENMGPSKFEKAQKLGIKIVNENEFLAMIGV